MQVEELAERLPAFCRAKYGVDDLEVFDVVAMPGHAGFAYGFRVSVESRTDAWFIRLPPPNVNWRGTADVLRQVAVLNALEGTSVPHCTVRWSGADLEWFDCPYFVVPWLQGDVLRLGPDDWASALSDGQRYELGKQAMGALAKIHQVAIEKTPYLGDAVPFQEDVMRWDRFYERSADPECLKDAPTVRGRLLDNLPTDTPVGIFHGDFQTANLFCATEGEDAGKLLAVIDWELTGIGATLNDVGWIATFSDPDAWASAATPRPMFLDPETLIELYAEAHGKGLPNLNWFRALAAYKFAIITGFNLSLHRRGKRVDPSWEDTGRSMTPLINRALELLG